MMARYQIRDDHFGRALIEADSARDALVTYVTHRLAERLRRFEVEELDDGSATVVHEDERLYAVRYGDGKYDP